MPSTEILLCRDLRLVAHSVQCCSTLEDTYRMSIDYYAALDRAARKLMSLNDNVLVKLTEKDRG